MSNWLPAEFEPGLVSVVIPTYNRAALLAETLESVFNQTHDQVEVLLVDDGSSDETGQVAEQWRRRFDTRRSGRLEYIRQDHLGGQAARNSGTQASRGEFVNYLDDDDLLSPDKIAAQLDTARATDAELVYGPYRYFIHDAAGWGLRAPQCTSPRTGTRNVFEDWLRGWSWFFMAGLFHRELVQRIGAWNESLRCCQDLEFSARCFRLEPRMAHCAQGMVYRRHHSESVSNRSFAPAAYEDSLVAFAGVVEGLALEALPGESGRSALAQYLGRHAIRFFAKGSQRGAAFCAARVSEYDPGYRPRKSGLSTRLAYRLGGFRLWAWKDRMRDRFKSLGRRLRGKEEGFHRVASLELASGRETAAT